MCVRPAFLEQLIDNAAANPICAVICDTGFMGNIIGKLKTDAGNIIASW